ncbi:hypothetical protein EPUS_06666 [Endocarpon pusillum Z07020]|uniref:DNA mismatch repair protein S5 domain-containing protein n=1 Tax=Endocarpon pusillum (strain Z07020 / HMAS-L-300199) TaxID=1263415 RepID=U1HJ84_ENDPU|nr:uncharacterized protein EPUS_06666 [Endocarpon pusillum Z07020]ERF68979.1 hypothetical protein EPUS_06666 [Endocarpon pusillum Z07020]
MKISDLFSCSTSPASHPVGTTVRVQDLLKTIPVRRQTALKATSRTLSDIKKILQAYAFARSNVRISFKVLGGKNDKYNWTYGPTPGTSLLAATAKIVGQEVAAQCEARSWASNPGNEGEKSYIIDAVVSTGEGDPIRVGSKGHFISIDGRPISTTRGMFKDFVKLYKSYYNNWISRVRSTDCSVDPFLCLHLLCPTGTYDVNIEPAKDEVLFTGTKNVGDLLEDFLKSVYGDLPEKINQLGPKSDGGILNTSDGQSFQLLLAKKDPSSINRLNHAFKRNDSADVVKETNGEQKLELDNQSSAAYQVLESDHARQDKPPSDTVSGAEARSHRNMYDFDEDDLGTMEPGLSPEQSPIDEADEAELRKASVTNPWTIAKLNTPVTSTTGFTTNMSARNSNEQLMTPGPERRSNNLFSTSHRKPLVTPTNLPSPARSESSRSPPFYQNPGPPPRRRAPIHRVEEDEIEFTQEPTTEDRARPRPSFLELWAKKKPHKADLPSLQQAPETTNVNHCLVAHHDNEGSDHTPTELQSTQLTEPVDIAVSIVQSGSGLLKPFIPPFRTPERSPTLHPPLKLTPTGPTHPEQQSPTRQPWGWSQDDRRSTSPVSHGHPPPLSQSHQHPMASPPILQPSPPQLLRSSRQAIHTPHPDLEEIMDFEHRKKAVNAERRRQTKLTNRYLNPGQLAQIQRDSTASLPAPDRDLSSPGPSRNHPASSVNLRDERKISYNPAKPISHSPTKPPLPCDQELAPDNPAQKQSPHQNRYQAAKAVLAPSKSPTALSHAHALEEQNSIREDTDSAETLPPLAEDDPRAYLIQHRGATRTHSNGHNPTSNPEISRTGLKLKRTKTSKLPLETIPSKSAIHNISAKPLILFAGLQNLKAQIRELGKVDAYPRTGNNEFMIWNANSKDVDAWEDKMRDLVRERYVVRLGGDGEEVPANLQLRLGTVLRAHCEELT